MGSRDLYTELDACKYLFLQEAREPQTNTLHMFLQEGRVSERTARREVGGMILEGHPVEIDDATKSFEILWPSYIAYVVTNESFALDDDPPDTYEGRRFRRYFQSRLLQQVKDNNRLSDEYPGPLLHFRIVCEHHLVDVISTQSPTVRRVNPREPIN